MDSEINSTQLANVCNCVIRWGRIKPWHNSESVYSKIITLYTGWLLLLQRKLALNKLCAITVNFSSTMVWLLGTDKTRRVSHRRTATYQQYLALASTCETEISISAKVTRWNANTLAGVGEQQLGTRTMHADTHSLGGRGSSTRWYRWMSWRTEGSERTGGPLTQLPEQRTQNTGGIVL